MLSEQKSFEIGSLNKVNRSLLNSNILCNQFMNECQARLNKSQLNYVFVQLTFVQDSPVVWIDSRRVA